MARQPTKEASRKEAEAESQLEMMPEAASNEQSAGALQPPSGNLPVAEAEFNPEADAGAGLEGAGQESFAIPFVIVLQKGSPQVDEAQGEYMPDAKPGMFLETVSKKLHDGKKGILFVPCGYRRVFLRWGARGTDQAGFKGEYKPEDAEKMISEKVVLLGERQRLYFPLADGKIDEKKCDRLSDTRNHYGMLLNPESGQFIPVLLSLASTQIKKSRNLNTALKNVELKGKDGHPYTPPTFYNIVRVTTIPESNELGSWHGVDFTLLPEDENKKLMNGRLYAAAKAFNETVKKGLVTQRYEDLGAEHNASNDGQGGDDKKF